MLEITKEHHRFSRFAESRSKGLLSNKLVRNLFYTTVVKGDT